MERADLIALACILLLLVLFAFVVVSLQCCFNECHRRRSALATSSSSRWLVAGAGGGGNTPQPRGRGGDPEAALPTTVRQVVLPLATVYRTAAAARSKEQEEEEECAVCLAALRDGEEARVLPCCGHGFHAQCVDTWLASRSTCPLCRVSFVARPPASALPRLAAERGDRSAMEVLVIDIPGLPAPSPAPAANLCDTDAVQ